MTRFALPELKRSRGSIVNISSKVAETGQGATSAYAAANGGRNALTREWAIELGKYGIRVNAVIVAECWTPLYASWIQSLPDPATAPQRIEATVPFERVAKTNIKWKVELPGRGSGTPISWGDQVFIVTAIKTDRVVDRDKLPKLEPRFEKRTTRPTNYYQFVVLSFDRRTGKPLWRH